MLHMLDTPGVLIKDQNWSLIYNRRYCLYENPFIKNKLFYKNIFETWNKYFINCVSWPKIMFQSWNLLKRVWTVGPKPVGRKMKNERAEIHKKWFFRANLTLPEKPNLTKFKIFGLVVKKLFRPSFLILRTSLVKEGLVRHKYPVVDKESYW